MHSAYSNFKLGCQTIVFGPVIRDVEEVFDLISAEGFRGVEIAQAPERILRGGAPISFSVLRELLAERELELISLLGGSIQSRAEFCASAPPDYLYIEDCDDAAITIARRNGIQLALHPHLFKPVYRLAHAEALLNQYPDLHFILDTAHVHIAGDDLNHTLDTFLHSSLGAGRLAAVHLKDWSPEYGQSSFRYAKGFTELGAGTVALDNVLSRLVESCYGGWLIWEQDSTQLSPRESMQISAQWLRDRSLLPEPFHSPTSDEPTHSAPSSFSEAALLRQTIRAGTLRVPECYDHILSALTHLPSVKYAHLWRCSESTHLVTRIGASRDVPNNTVLDYRHTLFEDTIREQTPRIYDLSAADTEGVSELTSWARAEGIASLVSVPILNPWNLNHVQFVLQLFGSSRTLDISQDLLHTLSHDIGLAADAAIDGMCSSVSLHATNLAWGCLHARDLIRCLRDLVRTYTYSDGVAVFVVDDSRTRLVLQSEAEHSTGTEWYSARDERFYEQSEGLVGQVWSQCTPLLTEDARAEYKWAGKSLERVTSDAYRCILYPIVAPNGQFIGVIRCRNRHVDCPPRIPEMFTEDDITIIESICRCIIPRYLMLIAEGLRIKASRYLAHELKQPVVGIRAVADELSLRMEGDQVATADCRQLIDDAWSYSSLLAVLTEYADTQRFWTGDVEVEPAPTRLLSEVVNPIVSQVRMLLRNRGISPHQVRTGGEDVTLNVDKTRLQQVYFNLISNAVKYREDDPQSFAVSIEVGMSDGECVVVFQDNGVGVQTGIEHLIFEEGVRGTESDHGENAGLGFGLFLAKGVIEAHGGTIELTNSRFPTEFTVRLPNSRVVRQVRQDAVDSAVKPLSISQAVR